jgi:hypothetical protein
MSLIARYPKRTPKKTDVDPDKPVFTVAEVGTLLGCSRWTVIRIFENEPGVLILLRPEKMHKRSRRMIRIPRHVFRRVKARLETLFLCRFCVSPAQSGQLLHQTQVIKSSIYSVFNSISTR